MKLLWSPLSPYARKVHIVADELGVLPRIELVRTATKPLNAELMAHNPLNKIPTLVLDDGTALFDSLVICDWLDQQAGGGKFIPASGAARAQALTWHALGSQLNDVVIDWRLEVIKAQPEQSAYVLETCARKTDACLAHLDALAGALAATPLNIGHLAVGCCLAYADFRFADLGWRAKYPALATWYAAYGERPSVRRAADLAEAAALAA